MFAERQARYPRGTYKVVASRQDGAVQYHLVNLATGEYQGAMAPWDLIKEIEGDLADNKYPQNTVQYRTWGANTQEAGEEARNVIRLTAKGAAPPEANGPTFIIRVLFRQNATWQGIIQWIEGRQERRYRSVNELLHLMDEAAERPPDMED